jgi:hypothetical protein
MRMLIGVALIISTSMTPALAETLACSTWQGIRTCTDAHGYVSHETEWQGRINGWDNAGDRWTTSRWQDREIITVKPPPDRR